MKWKHLLIPLGLTSSFALGVQYSTQTKQLIQTVTAQTSTYIEQYTGITLLPATKTQPPTTSQQPPPHTSKHTIINTTQTPTYEVILLPKPSTSATDETITKLQQENNTLKQQLHAATNITITNTLTETETQQPPIPYTTRSREISLHDLSQPFLNKFAEKTEHLLEKNLDPEQQAANTYTQSLRHLDILSPQQRKDIITKYTAYDQNFLTPLQKTQQLYTNTTDALPKLPKEKLSSLDDALHTYLPLEPTRCTTLSQLNPKTSLETWLSTIGTAYHVQFQLKKE